MQKTAELASEMDGHRLEPLKQRSTRRKSRAEKEQDMHCLGRPQRSKKVPKKFSEFTQGQGLDAPPDDQANLPSPRRSPRKW